MEVDFAQIFQREREPICLADGTVLFEAGDAADAVRTHTEWISTQVLATELELAPLTEPAGTGDLQSSGTVDDAPVTIHITDVRSAD